MHTKEHNGLHQAFQYLSTLSAHSLFNRKSKKLLLNDTRSIMTQEDSSSLEDDYSPFTSRSNSNITISSIEYTTSPTPTPSISTTNDTTHEPWRLLEDGQIHDEYFFSDRQDLLYTTMNDIIERYVYIYV